MKQYVKLFEDFSDSEAHDLAGQYFGPENEITSSTEEKLNDHWPKVTYKGQDYFKIFTSDEFNDKIGDAAGVGDKYQDQYEEYDEDEDEYYTEYTNVTVDGQESYEGYIKDEDTFISGWDMSPYNDRGEGDDPYAAFVYYKIDDDGNIKVISTEEDLSGSGVYSSHSMSRRRGPRSKGLSKDVPIPRSKSPLDKLKEKYPSLIDLRLD